MRILVAHPGASFSVADVCAGWVEALTGFGVQVAEFKLGDLLTFFEAARFEREPGMFTRALPTNEEVVRLAVDGLYADLAKRRPDVLIVVSGMFVPAELLDRARALDVLTVVIHTEAPYEDDRQIALAEHANVNLVNDPTNLDSYPRGLYLPHAYRPALHHPAPPDPGLACDLAFVGTGYASRIRFLEAMNLAGLDVLLAGNWQALAPESPLRPYVAHDVRECLNNTDTTRLYQSARAGLNLYRREANQPELADGWSCGPREIEMAACGLPFARDPRGESDELFPMLPSFTGPAEAAEQVRWLINHPGRDELGAAARAAIADRTFHNHAAQLLGLLEGVMS